MKKDKNIVKKQSIKQSEDTKRYKQKDSKENSLPDKEIGGRKGPEPTRYGDWEKNGRCIDF